MMRTLLVLALMLPGCLVQAPHTIEQHPYYRPRRQPAEAPAPVEQKAPEEAPAAKASPEVDRCVATRAERIVEAKEAITTFRARMKVLTPLADWAEAHHCALKDTTGSVLVNRTKEAGGTRVTVTHGHPDDLICDTTKLPEGLDVDTMHELFTAAATDPTDEMFATYPECDAKETPSLRFTYADTKRQDAILKL